MKIAINGFGRIGRLTFRNLFGQKDVDIVAINDLTDNKTLAHLLKFDSAHGKFDGLVKADENSIVIDGKRIEAHSERDPSKLPWESLDVDLVLECTGIFRTYDKASLHLKAGAKKVLISAPGKSDEIQTIVLGVNDHQIDMNNKVFSCASCTTNCAAPVVKVVHEKWVMKQAALTTVHAYTADQRLQDAPHNDLRRARAAAVNIVPTSTGAASAVAKVYPESDGKIEAMAIRVPVITGSLIQLTCWVENKTTVEEINGQFRAGANGQLAHILEYSEDELVSTDIIGNQHSAVFDSKLTHVAGNMIRVAAWYDNEAGYAARLADLACRLG